VVVNPGRGYRFYLGDNVVYEFGHGLSFSTFLYSWGEGTATDGVAHRSQYGLANTLSVQMEVSVKNEDALRAGDEVVLVFLAPPADAASSVGQAPLKQLRFFEKISLKPHEIKTVNVSLTDIDFSLADESGHMSVVHGLWTVQVGTLSTTVLI
jgi:beta-glucosidase